MQPLKGIFFKLGAVFLFVTMFSMIKVTSDHVPAGQAVFFRAAFAIPVILVWLTVQGELRNGFKVVSPLGHFWRGVIGTTAMALNFAALSLLPLPEITAIGFAAPLLIVVFAIFLLKENVGIIRLSAVGVGLLGVLIIIEPRLTLFSDGPFSKSEAIGVGMVLTGAAFAALAQIQIRKLVQFERTSAIVFYFSLTSTLLALLTAPFGWVALTPAETVLLMSTGIIGGIGQIFLTSSYRYAPASVVAPFDYAAMIFALLIGYFIFDEVPSQQMLIGSSVVVAAGVFIILREAQLGFKRGKARSLKSPQG
jgi:drug/metabolite transporter (DMT)-like permease